MHLGRLRRGELLVALGLVGLVVSALLDWFAPDGDATVADGLGIGALGRPWVDLVALAALALVAVLLTALRSGRGRPTYGALVALVLAIPLVALTLLVTAVRALLLGPGAQAVAGGDVDLGPAAGTWLGLAALAVALGGLWVALADDRTNARESAYVPTAQRPVPALRPDAPGTTAPRD